MRVYLDYAATTPVDEEVFEAMKPYFSKDFGNPMALHAFGQEARKAVEEARAIIADHFEVSHEEIIFTSGATESNNLAVKGIIGGMKHETWNMKHEAWNMKHETRDKFQETHQGEVEATRNKLQTRYNFPNSKFETQSKGVLPHIVTTAYEHHCLLDSVKSLVKSGEVEATFVRPGKDGVIDPEKIQEAIKPNTVLVSVMQVNNEIGTINPLSEIGKIVQKEKITRREKAGIAHKEALPIYFHSDITQGVNYLPFLAKEFNVDLFSLSGHKIYGPKGVGILGVKKEVKLKRMQDGGAQEFGLRAGTHNVTGIVGIGKAVENIKHEAWSRKHRKEVGDLRDYFWGKLQKEVKNVALNGSMEKRVVNNLNVSFKGVEGESLLMLLDMAGIACSTGSACGSESLEPSHVLLSLGLSHPDAHGSLRFTLGKGNSKEEIDYSVAEIKKAVEKLRKIAGVR